MIIKGLIDEDFVNYKKPAMFISTSFCDWKCCREGGFSTTVCQNNDLATQKDIDIPIDKIYDRYINNPITKAIVLGGLEPMLQFKEVYALIQYFRMQGCKDDIIIYTGYEPFEIQGDIWQLTHNVDNIIMKFGRFIPNQSSHYDEILGVNLNSDNQRGVKIC